MTRNDKAKILQFVYERMWHIHKENPHCDYMILLKEVLDEMMQPEAPIESWDKERREMQTKTRKGKK
jgi:hypothetical protein